MIDNDIRQEIAELSEETVLFGGEDLMFGQAYDKSIIGLTADMRAVYDYDKMIQEYMADNDCGMEDAIEWIDYNTLRSIPYAGPMAPIVIIQKFNQEEII